MHASANFTQIRRFDGIVWLHKRKPVWVVAYPTPPAFQVFRCVERVKNKAAPWCSDNRVLSKDGFGTLEAALIAADASEPT